jgi:hypothetical protein
MTHRFGVWVICIAAALCAGCVTARRRPSAQGEIVNGVSLRIENAPPVITEGHRRKLRVVITNHTKEVVYLPARTMASSPSYYLQRIDGDGQPVGKALEALGWCQGVLLGDTAVEIPPRGIHTEYLLQETPRLEEPAVGGIYRMTVSLRYHIHTPTVVGRFGDPKARKIPEKDVWRGTISSGPVAVTVRPFDKARPRIKQLWKQINASPLTIKDDPVQRIYNVRNLNFRAGIVAAYIKRNLVASTWDEEERLIVGRNGYVIAFHHMSVHKGIAAFLADWRKQVEGTKIQQKGKPQ